LEMGRASLRSVRNDTSLAQTSLETIETQHRIALLQSSIPLQGTLSVQQIGMLVVLGNHHAFGRNQARLRNKPERLLICAKVRIWRIEEAEICLDCPC